MGTVFVCAIQKGGCGKTTTTLAVGAELAKLGKRVLLVDLDPQANLTESAGVDPSTVALTMSDVILHPEEGIEPVIVETQYGFHLAPSTLALSGTELMIINRIGRELSLRMALAKVRSAYDYIIIDSPPSLSTLTINALCAADRVLVPLQAHTLAFKAMPQLEEAIRLARALNPPLDIGGIALTMTSRTALTQQIEAETRRMYGDLVFTQTVPLTTRAAEAPAFGQPLGIYAPGSPAAVAYRAITQELVARYG